MNQMNLQLSMNLTFGNSQLLAFSPHPGPLPVEAVEGRGSRFKAPIRVHQQVETTQEFYGRLLRARRSADNRGPEIGR
jgi:hypothetical protein